MTDESADMNISLLKVKVREFWKQGKVRLWGPFGSILVHVLVVVVLIKFAVNSSVDHAPPVIVEMTMEADATKLDDIDKAIEEIKVEQDIPPPTDVPPPPSDVASVDSSVDTGGAAGAGGSGTQETGTGIGSGDPSLATGFEISAVKGPLVLKGLMANRTAGGRKGALSAYGGSALTETAVLKALRWLKANQLPEGSWPGVKAPYTGLALLAFLAHGETPASPEFGETVGKAIRWLMTQQNSKGSFSADSYGHAICTYALAEAFAMTKIMAIRAATERGVNVIIEGQQKEGGWFYRYEKGTKWDLSVMGWQIQALKAAKMGGMDTPQIEESLNQAARAVQSTYHNGRNSFCYQGTPGVAESGGPMWSMNGIGTLCLQYLGKGKSKEARGGLKAIEELDLVWGTVDTSGRAVPDADNWIGKNKKPAGEDWAKLVRVYAYYYITQAKFQGGGSAWKKWNDQFTRTLLMNQAPEGYWEGGDFGSTYGGSLGLPDKVYTTCFCCLMLEVYYRYLPTYKQVEAEPDASDKGSGDDVIVNVL